MHYCIQNSTELASYRLPALLLQVLKFLLLVDRNKGKRSVSLPLQSALLRVCTEAKARGIARLYYTGWLYVQLYDQPVTINLVPRQKWSPGPNYVDKNGPPLTNLVPQAKVVRINAEKCVEAGVLLVAMLLCT